MKKLFHVLYPATGFVHGGRLVRIDLLKTHLGKKIKKKLKKVLIRVHTSPTFTIEEIPALGMGDNIGVNVFSVTKIGEDADAFFVTEQITDVEPAQECCNIVSNPNETHFLLHDDDFYLVNSDDYDNGRIFLY